jgi:hypothetical protein
MGILSYLNTLTGGSIVERTYDNLTRTTVPPLTYISATGGTVIDDAGYRIHVFTSPGSFVVSSLNLSPGTVEYLVVAGGAAGGTGDVSGRYGGGGGAGGFRTATGFPVTATTYPITVGAGGAPGAGTGGAANSGNPSIFSTITSAGGGGGAGGLVSTPVAGGPGGSGGGGQNNIGGTGNTPPVSPPQGNPGGTTTVTGGSAGGGGAGAAGPSTAPVSAGGIGSPITWLPASYGTPGPAPGRYFAGGGSGGGTASGGAGGGGPNILPGTVNPGTTNTGGGGAGGQGPGGTPTVAGSGGSGIVVIRYPI